MKKDILNLEKLEKKRIKIFIFEKEIRYKKYIIVEFKRIRKKVFFFN
jgi:hypothetical protein